MKKQLFILLALVFTFSISNVTLSQQQDRYANSNGKLTLNSNKELIVDNETQMGSNNTDDPRAVTTVLPNTGGTSQFSRAPQSNFRYERCYYYISAAELATSGFTGVINSIGFNYSVASTASGTFSVWFELAPTFVDKGTNWNSAISTMTSAGPAGVIVLPAAAGTVDFPLTGGFNYPGGTGLWVAWQYSNPAGTLPGIFNTALCNTAIAAPVLRNSQADDSLRVIQTSVSGFRPETRLGNTLVDVADMPNLWYLGKVPYPWGSPDTVSVNVRRLISDPNPISVRIRIKNFDAPFITKFDTTIQLLRSLANSSPFDTIISVQTANYSFWKRDSILAEIVPIPSEQVPANNKKGGVQMQTCDSYNWRDVSHPINGGVGTGTAGTVVLSGFRTNAPFTLAAVDVSFTTTALQTNVRVYSQVAGNPGVLLYQSANFPTTNVGTVQHKLTTPLVIPAGVFYVGVEQTTATNIGLGYNTGLPKKGAVRYTVDGGVTWLDFNTAGAAFIPDICPKTWLTLTNKAFVEGFYLGNGVTRTGNMKMRIRSATTKLVIDSSIVPMNSSGVSVFKFLRVNCDSSYYWDLTSPCAVFVWSGQQQKFDVCDRQYNFSDAQNKAFGFSPMIQYPNDNSALTYALYTGDSDQDGCIGAGDISLIDNDVFNFAYNINTDVNGDGTVDANDLGLADNNATNFICGQRP